MGAAASTAAQPPPPSREDILESWLRVPLARRSQAVVAVETIVDEALEATQTYDVVVTLFGASSLPGTDGSRGTSDPYVVLKVGDATQTSDYIKNDENPNFSEAEYVFEDSAASTLEVSVFDKDWKTSDDVLGAVAVPLVGRGARHTPLTLDLSTVRSLEPGNVTLSWHQRRAQPEADAPPIDAPAGATRPGSRRTSRCSRPRPRPGRADVAEAVEALAAPKRAAPGAAGRTATVVVTILRATNLFNDVRERSKSDPYAVVTLGLGGAFLRVAFFDKDTNSADEGLGSTDVFLADAPQGPYVSGGGRTFALETLGDNMGKAQGSVTLSWVVEGLRRPRRRTGARRGRRGGAPAPAPADEDPRGRRRGARGRARGGGGAARDREAAEAKRLAAVAKERRRPRRASARKEASAKAAAEAKREAERAALARGAEAARARPRPRPSARRGRRRGRGHAAQGGGRGEAARGRAAAAKAPSEVVVRRELRAMKPADQRRFVNAIKKMMENPGGPGSSRVRQLFGVARRRGIRPRAEALREPADRKIYAHADCFDAAALGFAYDTLPKRRPQQLREPPDYALFRGLDLGLAVFQDAAYFLHVFVVPTEEAADFSPPLVPIPRDDHAYYAGSGSIFGGKGERCAHCASGKKVDVTVDVARALRHELKRGRKDVVLFTLVVDANTDELVVLDADTTETLGIPLPELVGPWYAPGDVVPDLNEATDKAAPGAKDMTLQLQKMLKNFGYYEGEVDADFGEMTTQAVKTFQDVNKLLQDGVVGPKTLGILKKVRNDVAKDIGDRDEARVAAGQWLKYTVGPAPGYLDRRAILAEVDAAFGQWAAAGGFRAERVDDADDAKIAGMKNRPGAFFFLPVMLHEVGHCLGLTHSAEYRDVMSPYYVANHANLTDNDVARLQKNLVL
ncbi:peptidase [Aureococcus anophagefferens]|nr:peptidase [Aureococcus anophagefferens]